MHDPSYDRTSRLRPPPPSRVGSRRHVLLAAYSLLLLSCDSPTASSGGETVDRIEVTPASLAMVTGETRPLTARLLDAGGRPVAGRRPFWSTQNASVVTVSQEGIVTAVAPGATQLSASHGGKSTLVPVAVAARPVTVVRISPSPASVRVGATVALAAEALDASGTVIQGRTVTWASSSPAVASVAATGIVTGVAPGNVTITATVDGIMGSTVVTVLPVPVASLRLAPSTPQTVETGRSLQLTATPLDADGNALAGRLVTFSSSSSGILSVSSSGLVVGIAAGSAVVTATSEGASASVTITVTNVGVVSVTIVPNGATMQVGTSVTLSLLLRDAAGNILSPTGRTIVWVSESPAVATVNQGGVVSAVASGSARIRVTADGVEASVSISVVTVPVASVVVTPATVALTQGATRQLAAVARDASGATLPGRVFAWSSSNPGVATVSSAGLVTAVGPGSAVVTATSGSASGSATITVGSVPIASISVAPSTLAIVVGATQTLTATAYDASNNALPGRTILWTSSAPSVASVSSAGTVTGISAGSATITAGSPGTTVTGTAAVSVTLSPVASVAVVPSSSTLSVGDHLTFAVTLTGPNGEALSTAGRTIVWSSSNTAAITIGASSGIATAVASTPAGSPVTITATVSTPGLTGSVTGTATLTVTAVTVASVRFGPFSGALYVGSAYARTVTAQTFDGGSPPVPLPGRPILWSSTQPSVVSISPSSSTNGSATVTALSSAGATVAIIATAAGAAGSFVADTLQVTTGLVPIASIDVDPSVATQSDSVAIGGSRSFVATARDAAGAVVSGAALGGRVPAWSLGGNGSGTIASSGASVTVTGTGTGTLQVQGAFGAATASLPLRVLTPVTSVALNVQSDSLFVGASSPVTASARDASNQVVPGRTVVLGSSSPTVASVGSGVGTGSISTTLTAVSAPNGRATATITASVPFDGATSNAPVIVLAPVATVSVTAPDSMLVGATANATATLRDAANHVLTGRTVTWSSAQPTIASVAASGAVTGVSAGTATITATAESRVGSSAVLVQLPVGRVALSAARTALVVNDVEPLVVQVLDTQDNPLQGRLVTYSASPGGIVTVSSAGVVTAVGPGTATVVASAGGKSSPGLQFVVTPIPVASVTVSAPVLALVVGQTVQATARAEDAGGNPLSLTGRNVVWSTTLPGVASVSNGASGGAVTGVDVGSTTVSVTVDGVPSSNGLVFTVSPPPVTSVTVTPATLTLPSTTGQGTLTATLKGAGGTPLAGRSCTLTASPPGRVQLAGPASGASDLNGEFVVTVTGVATHPSVSVGITCEGVAASAIVVVP